MRSSVFHMWKLSAGNRSTVITQERLPTSSNPPTPLLGSWPLPGVSPLIHPSSSLSALCSPEFPPFISMLAPSRALVLVIFRGRLVLLVLRSNAALTPDSVRKNLLIVSKEGSAPLKSPFFLSCSLYPIVEHSFFSPLILPPAANSVVLFTLH